MFEIRDASNQSRKTMENLSLEEVEKWLIQNRYDLFGWVIARGIESWPADYYLRYKTSL